MCDNHYYNTSAIQWIVSSSQWSTKQCLQANKAYPKLVPMCCCSVDSFNALSAGNPIPDRLGSLYTIMFVSVRVSAGGKWYTRGDVSAMLVSLPDRVSKSLSNKLTDTVHYMHRRALILLWTVTWPCWRCQSIIVLQSANHGSPRSTPPCINWHTL